MVIVLLEAIDRTIRTRQKTQQARCSKLTGATPRHKLRHKTARRTSGEMNTGT